MMESTTTTTKNSASIQKFKHQTLTVVLLSHPKYDDVKKCLPYTSSHDRGV